MEILDKFPRLKKFLELHPEMSIDDALRFTEKELEKIS